MANIDLGIINEKDLIDNVYKIVVSKKGEYKIQKCIFFHKLINKEENKILISTLNLLFPQVLTIIIQDYVKDIFIFNIEFEVIKSENCITSMTCKLMSQEIYINNNNVELLFNFNI